MSTSKPAIIGSRYTVLGTSLGEGHAEIAESFRTDEIAFLAKKNWKIHWKDIEKFPAGTRIKIYLIVKPENEVVFVTNVTAADKDSVETVTRKRETAAPLKPLYAGSHYVSEQNLESIRLIPNLLSETRVLPILITGKSGYGKTTLTSLIAKENNLDKCDVDCAKIIEAGDWFVVQKAENGTTYDFETRFVQAYKSGNTVINLDELSRVPPPVSGALFSALDDRQYIEHLNYTIPAGENVVVTMTANIGWQYTGTYALDPALVNRAVMRLEVDAPPPEYEVLILETHVGIDKAAAQKIVTVFNELRKPNFEGSGFDASTRSAKYVSRLVKHGMKPMTAFAVVIENNCAIEMRNDVNTLLRGHYGVSKTK